MTEILQKGENFGVWLTFRAYIAFGVTLAFNKISQIFVAAEADICTHKNITKINTCERK